MDAGSQAPVSGDSLEPDLAQETAPLGPRLELPHAAWELLGIVGFVTSDDGPLQESPEPGGLSSWQEEVLSSALERLEIIDHYLRGRVAFFVAGMDHGYGPFGGELELARPALDTCRAAARVVDALIAGRPPAHQDTEAMNDGAARTRPALKALESDGR